MLLLIWAAIDGIFYLMPNGEIYASGKYVVLFIGLAKFTDLAFGLTAEIISFSPKYKYNLYLLISLSVIAVLTNYLLIPILGITGAGLATFISYLIYNLLSYWLMYNRYKISPFSNDSIKAILLLSALFITISFLNFTNHSLINSGVKILFSIALLFIGIKKMNIRSDVYILSDRILKYIQGIFRRK
jgi:O-antigen/teichoic acid export membrane protein